MTGGRRRAPGWLWIVVPMALSALLVGAIAVAVRGGDGGDDGAASFEGPAAQLPAVVATAEELLGSAPPQASMASALGERVGEAAATLAAGADDLDVAEEFGRLPDALARLLGRSLGEIQVELSPTAVDGSRGDDDRAPDIVFALGVARAVVQALDPAATPREQALAALPFSVQDLVGFDEIAETFATGDLDALAERIDRAESGESGATGGLSESGAAEVVSSVAYLVGQRLPDAGGPGDADLRAAFLDGYAAGSG